MPLLSQDELKELAAKCGLDRDTVQHDLRKYSSELVGYLGEHLRLHLKVTKRGEEKQVVLFVKCMPRFDVYKAQYLRDNGFFRKEFVLLSSLFSQFPEREGLKKWRPTLLHSREEVLVFEDITQAGYATSDCRKPFTHDETVAAVEAVAKFHAESVIYENKRSKQLERSYKIWEDFSEFLIEPATSQSWRDTGRNGVIDLVKIYSTYKDLKNFSTTAEEIITLLFEEATASMTPSSKYPNVVVHRDVWSNNVLFKTMPGGNKHALIVDYQTALYTNPALDLAALLFINTTKKFRNDFTRKMLDIYYYCLSNVLEGEGIDVSKFMGREELGAAYENSTVFGITQAALILPIANMPDEIKDKYCKSGDKNFDSVSRSHCFIESLVDQQYRDSILELFDDIVERYVLPAIDKY
ncbi:unnamed protein product [Leptosia nina]|uniref:CHK kinase-like domain-containing protein n=1 Tax=Leptosia nina TaxID=320188 RepID=A0AAV1JR94_9NEOP